MLISSVFIVNEAPLSIVYSLLLTQIKMRKKEVSARLLTIGIIVSMFLWGLSWPSGKVLTQYTSMANFIVYRYILVVFTLVAILVAIKTSLSIKLKGLPFVLISGILLALYGYCFFLGLKKGSPGAGGVLVTILNPIMAYTLGMVLSRKLPKRNETIGLLLGLVAGCILLEVWQKGNALLAGGNLYFLAAALTWSVMSKFTSKGARYGSSLSFSVWQYLVTLLCLLPLLNVAEMRSTLAIKDIAFWGNLFFSSVIVTALATTLFFYSTTRLGAEKASSFIFLVPLAAALSSAAFLGEQIKLHTAIGGIIGMAAVYMINKKTRQPNISEGPLHVSTTE